MENTDFSGLCSVQIRFFKKRFILFLKQYPFNTLFYFSRKALLGRTANTKHMFLMENTDFFGPVRCKYIFQKNSFLKAQ